MIHKLLSAIFDITLDMVSPLLLNGNLQCDIFDITLWFGWQCAGGFSAPLVSLISTGIYDHHPYTITTHIWFNSHTLCVLIPGI